MDNTNNTETIDQSFHVGQGIILMEIYTDFLKLMIGIVNQGSLFLHQFQNNLKYQNRKYQLLGRRANKKLVKVEEVISETDSEPSEPKSTLSIGDASIFYRLYNYTDDLDAKRLLIDEMGLVGDARELPLLTAIYNGEHPSLGSAAKMAIEKLDQKERFKKTKHLSDDTVGLWQSIKEEPAKPLELCFVDAKVGATDAIENSEEVEIDFELDDELPDFQSA